MDDEDLSLFISYSPSSLDVLRFWDDCDTSFDLDFKPLQDFTEPGSSSESCYGIITTIPEQTTTTEENLGSGGSQSVLGDQEHEDIETGMIPFSCSGCQVLRDIVHTDGTCTTRLEIHGGIGLICHAIMEIDYGDHKFSLREQQVFDFRMQSIEEVKQVLIQYCQEREDTGFVMLHDPLLTFYSALCAGLNRDQVFNTDQFIHFKTEPVIPDVGRNNQPRAESNGIGIPKSSLAAQRERTGRLKLSDLVDYFHLPIEVTAKKLSICPTVLKKICRKNGMRRWPHRKIKSVDRQILNLQRSLKEKGGEESAAALAEMDRLKEERNRVCNFLVQ